MIFSFSIMMTKRVMDVVKAKVRVLLYETVVFPLFGSIPFYILQLLGKIVVNCVEHKLTVQVIT